MYLSNDWFSSITVTTWSMRGRPTAITKAANKPKRVKSPRKLAMTLHYRCGCKDRRGRPLQAPIGQTVFSAEQLSTNGFPSAPPVDRAFGGPLSTLLVRCDFKTTHTVHLPRSTLANLLALTWSEATRIVTSTSFNSISSTGRKKSEAGSAVRLTIVSMSSRTAWSKEVSSDSCQLGSMRRTFGKGWRCVSSSCSISTRLSTCNTLSDGHSARTVSQSVKLVRSIKSSMAASSIGRS
jgi:hypothetical protein